MQENSRPGAHLYTSREQVRTASMTSTLALVIAMEMAMCAMAASVSAMATSSH